MAVLDTILSGELTKFSSSEQVGIMMHYYYVDIDGQRFVNVRVPVFIDDFFRESVGKRVELSTLGVKKNTDGKVVLAVRCEGKLEAMRPPNIIYALASLFAPATILMLVLASFFLILFFMLILGGVLAFKEVNAGLGAGLLTMPAVAYLWFFSDLSPITEHRRKNAALARMK